MVLMHARACIWMLLLICLFGDKTGARAHVRWLPFLLRIDDLGRYSWGVRSASLAVQEPVSSSQQECRPDGRAVGSATEWSRFLPSSDEKDPRLQRLRRQLDLMPFSEFVCLPYRTLEVEAVLDRRILQEEHRALWCSINRPHPALNIDFLHAKDGRRSDQWFPQTFQRWHALWSTRFQQLFQVVPSADPGPTADFIRWWILAGRRYLVPADCFYHFPPNEIPIEATQRQSGPHPPCPDVPHLSDNRRPARRMMVGTRTTARDWQWLDDMMAEDAPAAPPTQKNRRMPVSYACRRGAGRPRRGGRAGRGRREGGDATPTQQAQGGSSTSRAVVEAGTS
ncbi:hypothetical protein PIB30_012395 [Stylosanthes scabra]|uniref:Aminotransferase-like plant mobile domain-containing protein n=1 Tax=Stylosanthes scabra TaxID=79078 RepID=A0ABU6R6F1_9FABA|nr:hypothetical protein [Stylosanthes scabra]